MTLTMFCEEFLTKESHIEHTKFLHHYFMTTHTSSKIEKYEERDDK
jgi:hypothetical protein